MLSNSWSNGIETSIADAVSTPRTTLITALAQNMPLNSANAVSDTFTLDCCTVSCYSDVGKYLGESVSYKNVESMLELFSFNYGNNSADAWRTSAVAAITDVVNKTVASVSNGITSLLNKALALPTQAGKYIDLAKKLWSIGKDPWGFAGDLLKGAAEGMFGDAAKRVVDGVMGVASMVTGAIGAAKEVVGNAVAVVKELAAVGVNVYNQVINTVATVKGLLGKAKSFLSGFNLADALNNLKNKIMTKAKALVGALKDSILQLYRKTVTIGKEVYTKLRKSWVHILDGEDGGDGGLMSMANQTKDMLNSDTFKKLLEDPSSIINASNILGKLGTLANIFDKTVSKVGNAFSSIYTLASGMNAVYCTLFSVIGGALDNIDSVNNSGGSILGGVADLANNVACLMAGSDNNLDKYTLELAYTGDKFAALQDLLDRVPKLSECQ